MRQDQVIAELTLSAGGGPRKPLLSRAGRDAIVSWLRETATRIESSKCGQYSWDQPDSKYRLSWVR